MTYLPLKLLILMMIADPTGELNLTETNEVYVLIGEIVRYCIVALTLVIISLSFAVSIFSRIRLERKLSYILVSIFLILVYGIVVGLFNNVSLNVFNEALGVIPLLFIPVILALKPKQQIMLGRFFLYSIIIVCVVKFTLSQVEALLSYGVPTWKVLLRQSPLLIFPLCYLLIKVMHGEYRTRDIMLLLITFTLILWAQARALNIALLLVVLILFIKFKVGAFKSTMIIALVLLAGLLQGFVTGMDFDSVYGIWSGIHFKDTVDYRVVQSAILLDRVIDFPTGVGFGYYTPGYLTYGDLAKPYQLELDLFNFGTKVGMVVFILYLFTYIVFAKCVYRKYSRFGERELFNMSYSLLIFSLLIYSLFQTFHSSVLYWIAYALAFSFIASREPQLPQAQRCQSPIADWRV